MKSSENQFSNPVFTPAFFKALKPEKHKKCESNVAGKTKALTGQQLYLQKLTRQTPQSKKHTIKINGSRFSCQERLHKTFGNSRRETQARKLLENEKCETWFHEEKTRLHMAEVSFLIAKIALCKRSLNYSTSH